MRYVKLVLAALLCGCAGISKSCSQFGASVGGSDWIVVQFDQTGRPFNCWKLRGAAVDNSEGGNVDWQDPTNGHLVHITGWENRVQVKDGNFASAARLVGVDEAQCNNGVYPDMRAPGVR